MINKFLDKVGHYSGNKILDCTKFEEPDYDSEKTLEKWFNSGKEIKY